MKQKRIIRITIAMLLIIAAARFAQILLLPPPVGSKQTSQSPDGRYVAKVSGRWRGDFWGRAPHEYHWVSVEGADGRVIRRIFTDEPWTGWPKDCVIQWATNSSSVSFIFKTDEALKTHLIIDIP